MSIQDLKLPLGLHPQPDLLTAGQPSPDDFRHAKAAGIKQVINLRPLAEDPGFDEAILMQELGIGYTLIPVAGAQDFNLANVKKLDRALHDKPEPTVVHCASANRVGALFALRAAWLQHKSNDEALAIGRAHGLTKLESTVAQLLESPPP